MKLLALAPLVALGCATTPPSPESAWPYQLDETGHLAIAGNCVVVEEASSLVCVPRAGAGEARELVRSADRTYVALAATADGTGVLATSLAGGQVRLDRVALDGTVTPLASAAATAGAGQLAVADRQVVLSTGSQLVLVDGAGGGVTSTLAQATGIIGGVAARAQQVAYIVDTSLKTVDLAGDDESQPSGGVTVAVAADAGALVVGRHLIDDTSYSFLQNDTTGDTCEIPGALSRIAVQAGHPFAIADGAIFDAAGAVADYPIAGDGDAFDLAVDEAYVYWITRDGTLDRVAR